MLGKMEGWYAATLQSLGDAVITANNQGHITFMNTLAESLTGWKMQDAYSKKLQDVFHVLKSDSREPLTDLEKQSTPSHGKEVVLLVPKTGGERSISFSRGPIKGEQGNIDGLAIVFHDLSSSKVG